MKNSGFSGTISEIPAAYIRTHLERVLSSPAFRASRRSHRFLSYVVTRTLEGNAETLKERTLAIEVFDRSPSWDAGEDTIVRGGAREVRKRLAQYYSSSEGIKERIRIEISPGSYVPIFVHTESIVTPAVEPPEPVLDAHRKKDQRQLWFLRMGVIVVFLAVAVAAVSRFAARSHFEDFWRPVWQSPYPMLIAVADPIVYHPSTRATRLNNQKLGPTPLPLQRPLRLLPNQLDGSDMVPALGQYVGYGDTVAAATIAGLSGRHSKDVRIRSADQVQFVDLREVPSALVGGFTNRWTMELSQNFRFHFGYDAQGAPAILDSAASRIWSIPSKEDNGVASEDYFIVCRLANSPSGKLIFIVAGLTQFGTEAAGRFLTDSGRLGETFRNVSGSWQSRNVELVFHAKVMGNSPSASELIASQVW